MNKAVLMIAFAISSLGSPLAESHALAQEQWWDSWAILDEKGYSHSTHGFARSGDSVYFIGRTNPDSESAQSSVSRDTFLHLNMSTGSVEECLPIEEVEKDFPQRISVADGSFVVNPQGTLLAVGNSEWITKEKDGKTTNLNQTSIMLVDLKQKTIRPLVDDRNQNFDFLFSPDGHFLLFRSYPSSSEKLLSGNEQAQSFSVSVVNVDTGERTVLKPAPKTLPELIVPQLQAAWAPDSRQVVFQYLDTDNPSSHWGVYVCRMPDWNARLVQERRFSFSEILFVDARRFVCGPAGGYVLIDIKSGKSHSLVTTDEKPATEKPISRIRLKGNTLEYRVGQEPNYSVRSIPIPTPIPGE